jgi:LysR family transcriptional regulator, transcription activator of glutamate synthase operon
MEINYLREFVILAQTGNFMEAADILYSSQSTLSKHIKNIETELGVPLFDRTTRKVGISKYGLLLLPYAKQITELQDKYTAILKSSRETDQDVLALGSIYGLAQYKITDVLVSFKKNRPQSTINVMQANSKDLTEMLRQRKFEMAFIRDIVDVNDEFVRIPYVTDTIVAVLPITHPLAKQKTIPLRKLADENFLMPVEGTMPGRLSMKACELSGFEPRVTYNDPELENHIDLVIKGMGVSLALKQLALYHSNPKVAIVDITPCVSTQIDLCYSKGMEISEAAKYFMVCTETQKNNLSLRK